MAMITDKDGFSSFVPDVGPTKEEKLSLEKEALDTKKEKLRVTRLALANSELALNTLIEIMCDPLSKPAERLSAANSVLDRGLGKPRQAVEIEGVEDGAPIGFQIVTTIVDPRGDKEG